MPYYIDILHLFPDLCSIGHDQLQAYCNEWLQRPISEQSGVAQILVDNQLRMQILLDRRQAELHGDHAFVPLDQLLEYVVDRHFKEAETRQRLHAEIRQAKLQDGPEMSITMGRVGTLYFVCKNPPCSAKIMTEHKAAEGQQIDCPPFDIMCIHCGYTYRYFADDFQLKFDS